MYKKRRSGGLTRVSFQSRSDSIVGGDSPTERSTVKASILKHQSLLQALLKNTSSKTKQSFAHI
jgi:hypothetical protein